MSCLQFDWVSMTHLLPKNGGVLAQGFTHCHYQVFSTIGYFFSATSLVILNKKIL